MAQPVFLEILAAILLSFGSTVAAVILMTSELQVDAARISGIVITLLNIPQIVLQVVRLLYLNKTISIFSSVGE